MQVEKALAAIHRKHAREKQKLIAPLRKEIQWAEDRLETLKHMLSELTGKGSENGSTVSVAQRVGKRRKRKSSETLNKKAAEIVDFIESKGKATADEILRKFGKIKPSISAFLKGRTKKKVRHAGARNKRVYTVA